MSRHLERIWNEVVEAKQSSEKWDCDDWDCFVTRLEEIVKNHKGDITDTTEDTLHTHEFIRIPTLFGNPIFPLRRYRCTCGQMAYSRYNRRTGWSDLTLYKQDPDPPATEPTAQSRRIGYGPDRFEPKDPTEK